MGDRSTKSENGKQGERHPELVSGYLQVTNKAKNDGDRIIMEFLLLKTEKINSLEFLRKALALQKKWIWKLYKKIIEKLPHQYNG
jgi:hypothetical protein